MRVYFVNYQVPDNHGQCYGGPLGDGSFCQRFRRRKDAEAFARARMAAGCHWYGGQIRVDVDNVSARLACRWGV